jgi:hypothetical protein
MRPGENCLVAPYPDIERIAESLITAIADPARGEAIARQARATASAYTYSAFRAAWIAELAQALGLDATA